MRRLVMIPVAAATVGGLIVLGTHQKQETAYGAPPTAQVVAQGQPIVIGQSAGTIGQSGVVTVTVGDDEKDEEKEETEIVAPFGFNVLNMEGQADALHDQVEAMKDQAESMRELGGLKLLLRDNGQRSAYAKARAKVAKLQRALRDADDKKKAELTKQLETAISECFDEDMKVREGELTKVEQRLAKLRTRLDKRKKARTDIIQLEMKVLTNEAEGLGFSPISGSDHFNHSYGFGFSTGMGESGDESGIVRKMKNRRHVVIDRRSKKSKTPAASTPAPPAPPGAPAVPAPPAVKATSL